MTLWLNLVDIVHYRLYCSTVPKGVFVILLGLSFLLLALIAGIAAGGSDRG